MINPEVPEQIIAAGGVVFRVNDGVTEILLIERNGVWDLPKGKQEDGESIPECAVREVAEETGVNELPIIVNNLGTTFHEYRQGDRYFAKTTRWYSMIWVRMPETFTPQLKEGITKTEWVPVPQALEMAGYENLKSVISRFAETNVH